MQFGQSAGIFVVCAPPKREYVAAPLVIDTFILMFLLVNFAIFTDAFFTLKHLPFNFHRIFTDIFCWFIYEVISPFFEFSSVVYELPATQD